MKKWIQLKHLRWGLATLAAGFLVFLAVVGLASAGPAAPAPLAQRQPPADESCLYCHSNPDLTTEIGGETVHLAIDEGIFSTSVHRDAGVKCADCHTDIRTFPHPEMTASSPREYSIQMYATCRQCHEEQYDKVLDSVHQSKLDEGNINAAICTDCHDPHAQTRLTNQETGKLLASARLKIPQTCAQCHDQIYETYKKSVHGAALTQEGDPFVPTCIDCHGVHNISDPTTNSFRNSTPYLCAECHTNRGIMDQYGISTNVLNTYVADFHGTTVEVFDKTFPDQPTNKPVCTDCHGFHDIVPVDDPQAGIAIKSNLLVKCQQCHPDATTDTFTESWLSHYEPSPEHSPLVYYVNLFYKIFIPTVLGGMSVFVLSDIYRRFIVSRRVKKGSARK